MTPETLASLHRWYFDVLLLGIILLLWLETAFYQIPLKSERARAIHAAHNFGIWVIAVLIANQLVGNYLLDIPQRPHEVGFGVFHWIPIPFIVQLLLGILLLDLADYLFHVLVHRVQWLWLLHSVHHSDTDLDVTTSLRFHPLEAAASLTWTFAVLILMGLPLWLLAVRSLFSLPFTLMQHMNVAFPASLDKALRWILITPHLHRIHHSPLEQENNRNFGSTLSVWDRLFGTLHEHSAPKDMVYGLAKLKNSDWQSVWGMLKTPISARNMGFL